MKQAYLATGIIAVGVFGLILWTRPSISCHPNVIYRGEPTTVRWRNFTEGEPLILTIYYFDDELDSITLFVGSGALFIPGTTTEYLSPGEYTFVAEQPSVNKSARTVLTIK